VEEDEEKASTHITFTSGSKLSSLWDKNVKRGLFLLSLRTLRTLAG